MSFTFNPFTSNFDAVDAPAAATVANVKSFGAKGDGTTDDTTAVQAAITSLASSGGIVFFPMGTYKITGTGLTITNQSNLRITGKATVQLIGAASNAMIFQFIGTCTNVEIDTLILVGDNNNTYQQEGVGLFSGQTLTNISLHNLDVSNLNVGLDIGADLSGTVNSVWINNNKISNIIGTSSGQGYGIHSSNTTGAVIQDNIIDNVQRHAIYQAKGGNSIISGNTILNHRSTVATGGLLTAISIARSSNVLCTNNKFYNCYDSQIGVDNDSLNSIDCSHITITGNKFYNRQNGVPCIYGGEQAVPTTAFLFDITIENNHFYDDYAKTNGAEAIRFNNGYDLNILNNTFYIANVGGEAQSIVLGNNAFISSSADFTNTKTIGNVHIFEGSTLTDTEAVVLCTTIQSNASIHKIANNAYTNVTSRVSPTTWSNTNITFEDIIGNLSTNVSTNANTFTGSLAASNLSGTNSGDVTLTAVGSSPSANGASLSGQALTLQPADGTHPGLMTTGTQTIAGAKTFSTIVKSPAFITNSANPATGGVIRLANLDRINWRNSGNTADHVLDVNASDQLEFNGTALFNGVGVLQAAAFPALTGDVTTSAGSLATSLVATTNATLTTLSALTQVGSSLGINTTVNTATLISGAGTHPSGTTSSTGVSMAYTSNSGNTANVRGYNAAITTAASTTVTTAVNYRSAAMALGSGGAITTFIDFNAGGAAAHNATNNAAFSDVGNPSGNFFIFQNGSDANQLGGALTVNGNVINGAAVSTKNYDTSSVTSGTITASANKPGLLITGAGGTTLTIKLPSSPIDGQIYWVASQGTFTTVTWQDAGGTAGNVIGGQAAIGGTTRSQTFLYSTANTKWFSIS